VNNVPDRAVSEKVVAGKMEEIITSAGNQEARYRIKALIDELDLGQQESILAKRRS